MTDVGLRVSVEGRTTTIPPGGRAGIGRATSCQIQVADDRVSRMHAEVRATAEGWLFVDLDSSHGSWLHGDRVRQQLIAGPMVLHLADPTTGTPMALEAQGSVPRIAAPEPGPGLAAEVRGVRPAVQPTGTFQAVHAATSRVGIGRAADNDVVIEDLMVSRHHAEVRSRPDGSSELVDLGSLNGTFVNGERTERRVVGELDVIGVGHSELRLVGGRLEEYVDAGAVTFEAIGLTVTGREGRTLVDDVSFALPERSLLAVVGPSGAGKSTLLAALSGLRPAPVGRVLYGGRDLYADYAELRHRIGLVPQEDVLHRELELQRALDYSGRLRFPTDVTPDDRRQRVGEVLAELGLSHRATSPITQLSGGERKRTNVALELLTKPSLLLLDEPVSGLDPGLARVLMHLLRDLADDGRTVVVVTHEISSLAVCDQVLVLAPGGVPAYVGPPGDAPARFGETDMAEVFTDLVTTEGVDWHLGRTPPETPPPAVGPGPEAVGDDRRAETTAGTTVASRKGWWSQLRTLTARSVEVLAADRRNAALLLLQAPILGVLLLVALPAGELGQPGSTEVRLVSAAGIVLFVLLVGATWLGANNAIREIARELPVLRRERAAGLSLSAYVLSKALVLGVLTTVQAIVLVALATARQNGPGDDALLGWGTGELMVVVALAGMASMALGLLISALAGTPERATSVLPVVLILQLVLAAGVVLPEIVDKPVLNQMSLLSSTQWGVSGAASTVDLNQLQVFDDRLRELRTVDADDPDRAVEILATEPTPSSWWAHTVGAWLTSALALIVLTAAPLGATGLVLRRYEPGRP